MKFYSPLDNIADNICHMDKYIAHKFESDAFLQPESIRCTWSRARIGIARDRYSRSRISSMMCQYPPIVPCSRWRSFPIRNNRQILDPRDKRDSFSNHPSNFNVSYFITAPTAYVPLLTSKLFRANANCYLLHAKHLSLRDSRNLLIN